MHVDEDQAVAVLREDVDAVQLRQRKAERMLDRRQRRCSFPLVAGAVTAGASGSCAQKILRRAFGNSKVERRAAADTVATPPARRRRAGECMQRDRQTVFVRQLKPGRSRALWRLGASTALPAAPLIARSTVRRTNWCTACESRKRTSVWPDAR